MTHKFIANERICKKAAHALEVAKGMADSKGMKALHGYGVSNHLECIQFHYCGYAEPGYSDPECGLIATGNWNDYRGTDLASRLCSIFEKLGIEIEWSDEWSDCSGCGKLVRTSADSYSWQPSYTLGDGEINCHECITENAEEHLASLEGNADTCNTIEDIDPADYGYVCFNEDSYETGWHPGQNDDPHKVAKFFEAHDVSRYLFQLDENSQFYSRWSAYVHESEVDKLPTKADETE